MANWTEADLQSEMQNAISSGWMPHFEAAAQAHGFPVELLLAIASRETNMRNIKADRRDGVYHGYGVMQVDIGTDPGFCNNWTPEDIQSSIECGAKVLARKRDYLASKGITDLAAIAAAYNTGEGNVVRSIASGAHFDQTTTGGNYGRDVLARMDVFFRLRSSVEVDTHSGDAARASVG